MTLIPRSEVRAYLKATMKVASGLHQTLLCMLVSHARGKLHCNYYRKYEGGWRGDLVPVPAQPPTPKAIRCYGEWAGHYLAMAAIRNLDDQAACIRRYMRRLTAHEQQIAAQILGDTEIAKVA